MARSIDQSRRFKKQLRLMRKRGKDITKALSVIRLLAFDQPLSPHHRDHQLVGNFKGCRECHIEPDWLLIYRYTEDNGLELVETGTHADLF